MIARTVVQRRRDNRDPIKIKFFLQAHNVELSLQLVKQTCYRIGHFSRTVAPYRRSTRTDSRQETV